VARAVGTVASHGEPVLNAVPGVVRVVVRVCALVWPPGLRHAHQANEQDKTASFLVTPLV
jgi:hypothetical protein